MKSAVVSKQVFSYRWHVFELSCIGHPGKTSVTHINTERRKVPSYANERFSMRCGRGYSQHTKGAQEETHTDTNFKLTLAFGLFFGCDNVWTSDIHTKAYNYIICSLFFQISNRKKWHIWNIYENVNKLYWKYWQKIYNNIY